LIKTYELTLDQQYKDYFSNELNAVIVFSKNT
jgi:hypothetical protein